MPKDVNEEKLKNTSWEYLNNLFTAFNNIPQEEFNDEKSQKIGKDLKEGIEEILDKVKAQCIKRNKMGNYVPIEEPEYRDLLDCFIYCDELCRELPQNLRENDAVKNLHSALLKGRNAMTSLPVDDLPPLEEVLRDMMPTTIHLTNKNSGDLHGGMSSRTPITYTDDMGNVRRGIVTKEDHVTPTPESELKRIGIEIIKKYHCPINVINEAIRDKDYLKLLENNDMERLGEYLNRASWFDRLDPDMAKRIKIYTDLTIGLLDVSRQSKVLQVTGIEPGSKIARRNGAMSDVAKRLGFPDLLVESRRVTIEQDGKTVDGIIMESADMNADDFRKSYKDSPYFKVKPEEFNNSKFLQSLSNLQVIDYLCGNTDRHYGNFFLKFDTSDPNNPKIEGVQGIDNDNSFGTIEDGGVMRLATADGLRVITPKMANGVEHLTYDDLDEILKDYELSENEIKAAHKRLDNLKNHIEKGKKPENALNLYGRGQAKLRFVPGAIYIVEDKDFKALSLDDLATDVIDEKENIFHQVKYALSKKYDDPFKDRKKNQIDYVNQDNDVNPYKALGDIRKELNDEYNALCRMEETLLSDGKEGKGGTRAFDNLTKSVHLLAAKYQKILKDTDNLRTMDDATMRKMDAFYKDIDANKEKVSLFAMAYKSKSIVRFSSKGRARYRVADELEQFVRPENMKSKSLYESGKNEIKREIQSLPEKNAFEISSKAANRLGSMMENTMRSNVEKLAHNTANYTLGVRALEAQKKLWKFSQSDVYVKPAKKDEHIENTNHRQQISINDMERHNAKDVSAEINAILAYVDTQKPADKGKLSVRQQLKVKKMDSKSMTPKEVKSFLGMVFEHESRNLNPAKTAKKQKSARTVGK